MPTCIPLSNIHEPTMKHETDQQVENKTVRLSKKVKQILLCLTPHVKWCVLKVSNGKEMQMKLSSVV